MKEYFDRDNSVGWRSFRSMVSRKIQKEGEEFVNSYTFNKVDSRKRAMYVMGIANENNWSTDAKEKIAKRASKYKGENK